jgi:hypothetical protein
MYSSIFKYPTEYTESWDSYLEYRQELMDAIEYHIENYESVLPKVKAQARILDENFFSASAILENIE